MSQDTRSSDIWKHFSKLTINFASCDSCKKYGSYKSSVTNFKKNIYFHI